MKPGIRLLFCLMAAFLTVMPARAQVDSLQLRRLEEKLGQYCAAMAAQSIPDKCKECDFLLESVSDPALRDAVAVRLYAYFMQSPLMGDEAVAIYLTDNWFDPGKVHFPSEIDLMNARIFAQFNRQSLLGRDAPSLALWTPSGESETIPRTGADAYQVLYFYAADCPVCKVETPRLVRFLSEQDTPLTVYAVYTGQDAGVWKQVRDSSFAVDSEVVEVHHLWDPELESDYQMKYGLLQTPRLFLLDRSGRIVGRGLDAASLEKLLAAIPDARPYAYGGEESERFFSDVFAAYGNDLTAGDVREVATHVASRALAAKDTVLYKHLSGDLLYYLSGRRGEAFKAGTGFVADSLILSRGDIWRTADDSLQVVMLASLMHEILGRSAVGTRLPDLQVSGSLRNFRRSRPGKWNLQRIGGRPSYLMIYSWGCSGCQAEMDALDALFTAAHAADRQVRRAARRMRVLLVDMDDVLTNDPETGERLLDTFDLAELPFILEADRKGVVVRKYLRFSGASE